MNKIKIGTRGSRLALIQAETIKRGIEKIRPGIAVEIIKIKTKGDIAVDAALYNTGQKGIFVKEIEEALILKKIDVAVHSLKDMPAELIDGAKISAYLARENPGDVFISKKYTSLQDVGQAGSIGTSSRRRESQLKYARPDLAAGVLRGNVETRVKKAGGFDGIIIAAAGVIRLGLEKKIRQFLPVDIFTPCPGQGIIAAEIRKNDADLDEILSSISDKTSEICYRAEREFFGETGGGCSLPVGALCASEPEGFTLYGYIGSVDGLKVFRDSVRFDAGKTGEGKKLAQKLLGQGGREVLNEIKKQENTDNQHSV